MSRLAIALILVLLTTGLPAAANTPEAVVETTTDAMLQALDGRRDYYRANPDETYKLVDAILLPHFDRTFAAQQVLKKHWRSASPEQRTRFVEAFYRVLLKQYADRIVDFERDQLRILPARAPASGSIAKVQTEVTLEDGTPTRVDYVMRRSGDDWKVFDVYVEGVSYVVSYREEFNTEITNTSLEATIERLEREAAGDGDGDKKD